MNDLLLCMVRVYKSIEPQFNQSKKPEVLKRKALITGTLPWLNAAKHPQIILGLLASVNGYPLAYEISEDNKFEGYPMLPVIDTFKTKYKTGKPAGHHPLYKPVLLLSQTE